MRPEQDLAARADLLTPMALRVAATLRLADRIRDGRPTTAALAKACGADADALERLLRHLAGVGLVARDPDGRFTLTEVGAQLCDDHPSGLRARLDCTGALGRAELALGRLLDVVVTGQAAFPLVYGRAFWDDLAADEARTASFDLHMGQDVASWAPHVVAAYGWDGVGRVVDVGGGNGTLLAALLRSHPDLHGTLVEQPATAEAARRTFAAAGLAGRTEVVAGSFFDDLPAGGDVYVLCAVLHDWADADAGAILALCGVAAGSGGRLLVVEKAGREGSDPSPAMDLRLLAWFGGRERTAREIEALATAAGLRHERTIVAGDLALIELAAAH